MIKLDLIDDSDHDSNKWLNIDPMCYDNTMVTHYGYPIKQVVVQIYLVAGLVKEGTLKWPPLDF